MSRRFDSNRNSRIVSQPRPGTVYGRVSFTSNRDPGSLQAAINTETNNASQLVIHRNGSTMELTGNEARTLFSLLAKHYYGG